MELNEYQNRAAETLLPTSDNLNYLALGLASEAGEFAGKAKKLIRDGEFDGKAAMKELGDVLWYVAMAAKFERASATSPALGNGAMSRYSDAALWSRRKYQLTKYNHIRICPTKQWFSRTLTTSATISTQ